MEFLKYHALGNDYLVLTSEDTYFHESEITKEKVRKICHRNYGLGSDGILVGGKGDPRKGFNLTIFNPDGSKAEKSGNGIRIFALSLWDRKIVTQSNFNIMTSGGLVNAKVESSGKSVIVEMGSVSFSSDIIPLIGKSREVLNETIEINGEKIIFCAATIGNPHCIVLNKNSTKADVLRIGPMLEKHPNFPYRTNVQFLEVLDRKTIRIEIWERGVGYTLASGSSSCAAASAAHRLGLCDDEITVIMPGGKIEILINQNYEITMKGSVTRVGKMELDLECLSFVFPS